MSVHVYLLVSMAPESVVSQFYLKGKSVIMLDTHSNLKNKFGDRYFWTEGIMLVPYDTVKNTSMNEKCIITMNKLIVKKYKNPFK